MRFGSLKSFVVGIVFVVGANLLGPLGSTASAQSFRERELFVGLTASGAAVELAPGQSRTFSLGNRYFLHRLELNVDSIGGNSGAEVYVNGDLKGNVWLQPSDPRWHVTVEQETDRVTIKAIPGQMRPHGRFLVRGIKAIVSETDWESPVVVSPEAPSPCTGCERYEFPVYYKTPLANLANRAIVLVDRLQTFTNYEDYGTYLLPIKKIAAQVRAIAEARSSASSYGRPYYFKFLAELDRSQTFLMESFERSAAFDTALDLLRVREEVRDSLD